MPRAEVYSAYKTPRQPPIAPLIRPDSPPGFPYPAVKHATREEMRQNFRMENPTLRREDREARKQAERDVRQLEKEAAHLVKDREQTHSGKRSATVLDNKAEKIREKALNKARSQKDKETSASRQPRDKEHRPRPQPLDMRGGSTRRKDVAPPVEMAAALARMFSGDEIETPLVSPAIGPSTVHAKYHNKVVAVKQPTIHWPHSPSSVPVPTRELKPKADRHDGKHPKKTADKDRQRTKENKRSWLAGLREAPSIESFVCNDAREIERGL